MRRHRFNVSWLILLGLVFLMVGDRLPDPVGEWGAQAKTNVNRFVIGLFPSWDPDLNPNQRTESQLQQTEKEQGR